MEFPDIIGKIALSKEGKVLGKVKRIDFSLDQNNALKVFVVIDYRRVLQKNILLALPMQLFKLRKITDDEVQIDISKKDCNYFIIKDKLDKQAKIAETKFGKIPDFDKAIFREYILRRW